MAHDAEMEGEPSARPLAWWGDHLEEIDVNVFKVSMVTLVAVGFVLAGAGLGQQAQACPGSKEEVAKKTQGERLEWRTDLKTALSDARKASKPTLVYFGTDECGACEKMVDGTLTDDKVKAELARFVTVHVDMTGGCEGTTSAMKEEYGVDSLPAVVFFDAKGEQVRAVQIDGAVTVEDFLSTVQKVAAR